MQESVKLRHREFFGRVDAVYDDLEFVSFLDQKLQFFIITQTSCTSACCQLIYRDLPLFALTQLPILGPVPQRSEANFKLKKFLSSSVISNSALRRANRMHDVTISSECILNLKRQLRQKLRNRLRKVLWNRPLVDEVLIPK